MAVIGTVRRVIGWRHLPLALLVAGALLRLGWAIALLPESHAEGEIANVATAYAKTGVLADPFRPGQGPTAHVLPLPPVFAGLVYRGLGIHSVPAELVLALVATAVVIASFALFYKAFGLIGTPRPFRLLGLAILCLVPLNISLEVESFRIWEGGLSAALAGFALLALLTLERRPQIGWGAIAGMAVVLGGLFFISPPLGLAAYLGSLLLLIDRLPLRRWPGATVLAVAGLALFVLPWGWRNAVVMGEALPLRSNFGLELALGNHPAALDTGNRRQVFRDRLEAIHPFESDAAFGALKAAGGEIAYARLKGAEARAWIDANPQGFATLCLHHLRDFFFPPAWLWNIYSDAGRAPALKALAHGALSAAALLGALVAGFAAWRRYRFPILMLLVPVLPYIIVQPVLRYRYIIYALSVAFAVDLAARVWARLSGRRLGLQVGDRRAA